MLLTIFENERERKKAILVFNIRETTISLNTCIKINPKNKITRGMYRVVTHINSRFALTGEGEWTIIKIYTLSGRWGHTAFSSLSYVSA